MLTKNVTRGNNYKLNNKLERSNLDTETKKKPSSDKKEDNILWQT